MQELYIIVPLLISAAAALLLGKKASAIKYLSLIASLASLALIISAFGSSAAPSPLVWFNVGGYAVNITTSLAPINYLLLLLVGLVTPLILTYSIGFMRTPSEQQRYYFELCVFAASMMLFAMSGNFITLFIAWEFLGITSYLLIGFWYWREGVTRSARKAITTVLIGDVCMLGAILLIWSAYHTLDFAALAALPHGASMTIALILIAIAAFTKSAQFPFHEWLPDAMAGPTPVSAFLHSSTMVKAGVFVIVLMFATFFSNHLLFVFMIFGLISAALGAMNAVSETHVKRILAYSTIEDLGLMFVAIGMNALYAAMLFFVVQTFYKALLFMSAGAMMTANEGKEDIREMKNTSSHIPLFASTLAGVASLAGIFPTSGFFGKLGIDMSATSLHVYVVLLAIEVLSSVYIFRWLILPISNSDSGDKARMKLRYRTLPATLKIPIYLLAIAIFAASAALMYLPSYLHAYGALPLRFNMLEIVVETIIALSGILIVYYASRSGMLSSKTSRHKVMHGVFYNSAIMNGAYVALSHATFVAARIADDSEYAIYKGIRHAMANVKSWSGFLLRRLPNGQTNSYILISAMGLAVLVVLFVK